MRLVIRLLETCDSILQLLDLSLQLNHFLVRSRRVGQARRWRTKEGLQRTPAWNGEAMS